MKEFEKKSIDNERNTFNEQLSFSCGHYLKVQDFSH